MAETLGIVDVVWRGQNIDAERGAKFKLPGIKLNPVVTGRNVHSSGEYEAGEVTATIPLKRGQKLGDVIGTTRTGELQYVCDSGQSYTAPEAFLTNRPEMTGGEGGKIELKWVFGECEELLNG